MKVLKHLIFAAILMVVATWSIGTALAAYDPLSGACSGASSAGNGQAGKSATCQDSATETATKDANGNYANPTYHIINVAADIIAVIGGIAGVITIIIGGMNYITSGGNSESITKGKNRIIGAIIGLVVIALAWTIVSFGVKLVSK